MLSSTFITLAVAATLGSAITVTYDNIYDKIDTELTKVACSNGDNGLITRKGWKTLRDIPTFPLIGGSDRIAGFNSPYCGTCWRLDYNGKNITILAIDHVDDGLGFNIGEDALNRLTNDQAEQLGKIEAKATQVNAKFCEK